MTTSRDAWPPWQAQDAEAASAERSTLDFELLTSLGVLPPPEILDRYRTTSPNLPGTIVGWIDEQITHRRQLECAAMRAREARRNRGQYFSAAIASLGLVCAAAVGLWGNPIVASVIAIAAVGGPTTAVALARIVPPPRAGP